MESRFQDYLLGLRSGGEIDYGLIQLVSSVLRSKLRARGLWSLPPSYVGLAEVDDRWDSAALELLALDAISWAIVGRLRAMCARIDVGDNVDGFVHRNLDFFLSDRQRRADPVGNATYECVHRIIEQRCTRGELIAVGETMIARGDPSARALSELELEQIVQNYARWTLLMRALSRGGSEASLEVGSLLDAVTANGDVSFDSGDLVVVLRTHARRWHDATRDGDDEQMDDSSRRIQKVMESRQLLSRLEEAIARSGGQQRRRDDLQRVLHEWQKAFEGGEDLSQGELAEKLEMKKTTLSDHVRRLRELVLEIDPGESDRTPL